MIHRRGLITGLVSLLAAPAIVRVSSIMPVKVFNVDGSWETPDEIARDITQMLRFIVEEYTTQNLGNFCLGSLQWEKDT